MGARPRVGRRRRSVGRAAVALSVLGLGACQPSGQNPSMIGEGAPRPEVVVVSGHSVVTWPTASTIAGIQQGVATTVFDATPASSTTVPGSDSEFGWTQAGAGIDRGALTVPANYNQPDGEKFTLTLARHRATNPEKRIGVLLVSPDGPGIPGTRLVLTARRLFDPQLLAHFDIIGWDARGTGLSTPAIDCIDDYDRFYVGAGSAEGSPADTAKSFFEGCAQRTGSALTNFSTNNSARDIESIRTALGREKISYLGFGYGAELGATWLTMFPDAARAVVLDSPPDPRADYSTRQTQKYSGVEAALGRFFSKCSSTRCGYASGDTPENAYTTLLNTLDQNPLTVDGRPAVDRNVAIGATIEAMYSDNDWGALDLSLQAAQNGDGSGLLALYDRSLGRQKDGSYPNDVEASRVISCVDGVGAVDATQLTGNLATAAPTLAPSNAIGTYECASFPVSPDTRVAITAGRTDAVVLVVGTTGGSAVPLEASQSMASALGTGGFLSVEANRHLGYDTSRCVVDAVNDVLIDLSIPNNPNC